MPQEQETFLRSLDNGLGEYLREEELFAKNPDLICGLESFHIVTFDISIQKGGEWARARSATIFGTGFRGIKQKGGISFIKIWPS